MEFNGKQHLHHQIFMTTKKENSHLNTNARVFIDMKNEPFDRLGLTIIVRIKYATIDVKIIKGNFERMLLLHLFLIITYRQTSVVYNCTVIMTICTQMI